MQDEQEQRYFYQPNMTTTIISWSWTFVILLVGIIIWLEITHFQWITATLFILFAILTILQVFRRTMIITPTKVIFNKVLQNKYLVIPKADIKHLKFNKQSMHFTINGQTMYFTFSQHTLYSIKKQLQPAQTEDES